jgi:hypothetical protein
MKLCSSAGVRPYRGPRTATESVCEIKAYLNIPAKICEVLAEHFESSDHISYTVYTQKCLR